MCYLHSIECYVQSVFVHDSNGIMKIKIGLAFYMLQNPYGWLYERFTNHNTLSRTLSSSKKKGRTLSFVN